MPPTISTTPAELDRQDLFIEGGLAATARLWGTRPTPRGTVGRQFPTPSSFRAGRLATMLPVAQEKTVAIVQSNYLPWKGYFDLIRRVDEFVLLDTVQYTRRDWRNRNRFKTPAGVRWLTVPVQVRGRYTQRIDETLVSDPAWGAHHYDALQNWYARAPYFKDYGPTVADALSTANDPNLAAVNRRLLMTLCELLGVTTPVTSASDYEADGRRTDLLVAICRAAGATRYLSGPAARAYLDEGRFADAGVAVEWMSYEGYPEYPQLHPPFDHHVSIIDLLFSVGPQALDYMLAP